VFIISPCLAPEMSQSTLAVSVDDMLKLIGPVLTLLVLAFGFVQLYPRFFQSMAAGKSFRAELERRTLRRVLTILKSTITLLALSAASIVAYPAVDLLQREWCEMPTWSDELLVAVSLAGLFAAIVCFAGGAWWIRVEMLMEPSREEWG
jgi:hypothetical protein